MEHQPLFGELIAAHEGLEEELKAVDVAGDLTLLHHADKSRTQADSVMAPVATVIKKGADRQWMSERLGHLPDGIYSLYLTPPTQAADSVLEDAAQRTNHAD